ncbi:alpha/beta hydrolase-fold protein [uncultured Paraglaciecola sp.]|uniref:alpha/beta hydrolase n=1 Tax=uncultured Paraglaciecola sp. TaxID=1765024 RepID=UPI002591B875|nr:alpha/beta hydrolase-fold protein [uncultured Paraglaciecola sp.]
MGDEASKINKSVNAFVAQDPVSLAQWYHLDSNIMDETREIGVYLPPSYKEQPDKDYPVIYLLDGDKTNLFGMSAIVESLSTDALEKQVPEFIVIAIPNTHRARDLTPTATDLIFKGKVLAKIEGSGGADIFLNFLETELLPKIDYTFRTTETKVLAGMSFGGLFAGHVLLHRPKLFSHYLLADATYVWDDNYLNRMLHKSKNLSSHKVKVFMALANNDHIGAHGVANLAWGNEFFDNLQSQSNDTFNVSKRYFPNERHGTVMMLAWYHGLIALFKKSP